MAKEKNKLKTKNMNRITMEDVIKEGSPILREISDDVALPISKEDRNTLNQMIDYVRSSQNPEEAGLRNLRASVGLSAIQLGIPKKLVYVRAINSQNIVIDEFALINPKITFKSDKTCYIEGGEGCLSVDDDKYKGNVSRHHVIKVEAIDFFTDRLVEIEAKGFTSIVLQHEIDHLHGIMFFDRINKLDSNYVPKNAIKI
jgi:peptide deformylase